MTRKGPRRNDPQGHYGTAYRSGFWVVVDRQTREESGAFRTAHAAELAAREANARKIFGDSSRNHLPAVRRAVSVKSVKRARQERA